MIDGNEIKCSSEYIELEYDSDLPEKMHNLITSYLKKFGTRPKGILLSSKDFLTLRVAKKLKDEHFMGVKIYCYPGHEPKILIDAEHAIYFAE